MDKKEYLKSKGVDIDNALNYTGDMETYDEIVRDFGDGLDTQLQNIENYKNSGDMANYAILVHALKSNARCVGFMELGEIAYSHELKSKENDLNYVNDNFEQLVKEANKVKSIILEYKNL